MPTRLKLHGPCGNCGMSLGVHSKRDLRVCQEAFFRWLNDMLMMAGVVFFLGKVLSNPKGFTEEVNKLSDTYTSGIKALMGEDNEHGL